MKSFEIHVERHQHYAVVRPVGELDLAAVDSVEDALSPLEHEFGELVIDLRAVEFLDSAGLRVLVAAYARSRSNGFKLRIINGGEPVQKVLTLTGMDRHLPLIDPNELGGIG
jgi:anti-anti-sigma factor